MKKQSLGRGLDALFEENSFDITEKPVTEAALIDIEPDKNQPRRDFDAAALDELAESIKQHGVISPLIVREIGEGRYRIIAGERRYRAAKLAGLDRVPVVVRDCSEQQTSEISLVENLQREDLGALEEAAGYRRLMDEFGLTQEQVAARVSRSRSAVANSLRLLTLPEKIMEMLKNGSLSAGHARALLALDDDGQKLEAAEKTVSAGLSVRQTEELVKKLKTGKKPVKTVDPEVAIAIKQLEERMSSGTGNKVRIKHGARGSGRVEVFYSSADELEKIVDMLS